MKVLLQDVINAIDDANDEFPYFYNTETEEVVTDPEDIEESDAYIALPSQYDRHDYAIMQSFINTVEDAEIKAWLTNAIHGRGAFRMFRATTDRFGITSDWYDYRDNAYREMAIDWCNENGIEFDDSKIVYDEEEDEEYIEPSPSLPDLRVITINKKNAMNILYMVEEKNVFIDSLNGITSKQDLNKAEQEISTLFNEDTYVYAVSLNGKLLGYAIAIKQNEAILLDTLYVRKNDRKQGIGSMLFEHVESVANDSELPLIHHVSIKNEYYLNFLKHRGYAYTNYIEIKKK